MNAVVFTPEEKWLDLKTSLETLRDAAFNAAHALFPEAPLRQFVSSYQHTPALEAYLRRIEERVPDRYEHIAYHVLIGSGILNMELAPKLDLPGDLSVQKFFESIIHNPRQYMMGSKIGSPNAEPTP